MNDAISIAEAQSCEKHTMDILTRVIPHGMEEGNILTVHATDAEWKATGRACRMYGYQITEPDGSFVCSCGVFHTIPQLGESLLEHEMDSAFAEQVMEAMYNWQDIKVEDLPF